MAGHKQNSVLVHSDVIYENITVLGVTARENIANNNNSLSSCWQESVSPMSHLFMPDIGRFHECPVHSPHAAVQFSETVDGKVLPESSPEDNSRDHISTNKHLLTFDIDVNNSSVMTYSAAKSQKPNLQEAFLQFRLKKQNEAREQRQLDGKGSETPPTPARLEELREKIIAQAKKYFGVPYARKYWEPHSPEYASPIFLDCCGLVRQVMRDLQKEMGFRLGPWNQAYMYDTLPVTVTKDQMKPGDLVFMSGVYVNPKNKRQLHNMLHVEIWLGEGDRTIGSRWNNGKVQVFDSYQFSPKSFTSEQYIFKSIDTWLMGICRSHCPQHPWRLKTSVPHRKSVFNVEDTICDEAASGESDDSLNMEDVSSRDEDDLDISNSEPLSHNIIEDSEHNSVCSDQALRSKNLAEKNNSELDMYRTRTHDKFSNTKLWLFNQSFRIMPIQNNNVQFDDKNNPESSNTTECFRDQSVSETTQNHEFQVFVRRVTRKNQGVESAMLNIFKADNFHNFVLEVVHKLLSENTTIMIMTSKSQLCNEKQYEGDSAVLSPLCSEEENMSSCWKTSPIKVYLIQRAGFDYRSIKDHSISAWHEARSLSSLAVNVISTNCCQLKPYGLPDPKNCVTSTMLRATSCPALERVSATAGCELNLVTCEEVGELYTHGGCDKKDIDGNCEMEDGALECCISNAEPLAKGDNSVKESFNESGTDGTPYPCWLSRQELTVTPTCCIDGRYASSQLRGSSGFTSDVSCESGNVRPRRALDNIRTSRKRMMSSRMRGSHKTLTLKMRRLGTHRHAGMRGRVRNLTSRMISKVRYIPSRIRSELKAHSVMKMIGTARHFSRAKTYDTNFVDKCLINKNAWPTLAIKIPLASPNNCDKPEVRKDGNVVDAKTQHLVNLKQNRGRASETHSNINFFVALELRLAALESTQIQLQRGTLMAAVKSAVCVEYFDKRPCLEDRSRPSGNLSTLLHSQKLYLKNRCNIYQHYFLSTLRTTSVDSTLNNTSPDFKEVCCDQTVSGEVQQFLDRQESVVSDNMNNNSSKDSCLDFKESGRMDSDENCQVKQISGSEKINKPVSQNVNKQQIPMTSDIAKKRTMESELTCETKPIWLKDPHRRKAAEEISMSPMEKQPDQSRKTAEGIGQSANDKRKFASGIAWGNCPETLTNALKASKEILQEMEDSNKHVARYILNQLPEQADDAGSRDSGFQSSSKGILSLSPSNYSEYSTAVASDDTDIVCTLLNTSKHFDRMDRKESCKAKPEDKKQDASLGPSGFETLENGDDLYSFCSVDTLNEFSKQSNIYPHPSRISQELRQYLSQDTTSNDGGDDDDIDDTRIDEDDELNFFDAEKQTSRSLLQNFARSHNADDDDDDDDDDYADFCGSMKETGDFSGSVGLLDHKSSLFPGGGKPPGSLGSEEGDKQVQTESINEQRLNIQSDGGSGDSYADTGEGRGGVYRRDRRPPKLTPCCLPTNMQPTFFIGGGNGISLVEGPLLALGWRRTADRYDERFKLKWVENKSRINYLTFREGEQLVNHIPNCKLLTNKLGLLCSLQEYERITLLTKGRLPRLRMADFVPETYKLDDKVDREKFIQEYKDGETWICKPTGMNQGKGIFLLRSKEKVDQLLGDRDSKLNPKCTNRGPLLRIVQRYICHPLLLEGRKFDIRSYMFIASTVPFLVLYHKGYVRLSCHKYSPEDNNLTIHLTNQFVQKKDPAYKDLKEDTAWTMDKLNDYINEHIAKEKGLEQDWVYGKLTKQMQRITLHCFNSVKHKLQCRMGYFDLYGLDFMVDADMKVWLIEINANPALHTNCQALKDAIPSVVEEAIYLALECFEKSCKGQSLMPLNSLASYSVLYCGSSPNTSAHREIRSVSPFKDITIWNRSSGTTVFGRQSRPYGLTRMETGNEEASSVVHAPHSKKYKRVSIMNSLPIIKLGLAPELKPQTGGESNKLNKRTQGHPSSLSQRHQSQPVKESSQTDLFSEVKKKQSLKYCKSNLKKTRENLFRGN